MMKVMRYFDYSQEPACRRCRIPILVHTVDLKLQNTAKTLNLSAVTTTGPLLLYIDIEITKYGQKH